MPTAAKLIAAFAFAAVAFFAANSLIPYFPEGAQLGWFIPGSAFIGAVCGWRVSGALAGKGVFASFGSGVRTSIVLVFWCLLTFSFYEMIQNSMKLRYDSPAEAVVAVFQIATDYLRLMVFVPETMGILILGGILAGWLVEWTRRRWS